jgi:hypothetical protein
LKFNFKTLTGTGNVTNVQNASPGSGSARGKVFSFLSLFKKKINIQVKLETISGTGNAKNVLQSWPLQGKSPGSGSARGKVFSFSPYLYNNKNTVELGNTYWYR